MNRTTVWTLAGFGIAAALVAAWLLHADTAAPAEHDVAHVTMNDAPAVGTSAATRAHRKHAAEEKADGDAATADAPEEAPSPPKLVRFVVKTREDKPIAGAQIDATPNDGATIHLVTGDDGVAKLPMPVPGSDVTCEIRANGFVTDRREFGVDDNGELSVQLHPARRVAGHVIDSLSDEPIPDARIAWWYGEALAEETTSDASGAFAFESFPADGGGLSVGAPGHVDVGMEPDRGADVEHLVFRLDPGGRVSGVVRRPDGTPAEGATVSASESRSVATGVDGRYVIDGLTFGTSHEIAAWLGGFAHTHARDPVVVTRDAPEAERDLVLSATATLVVTVVDADGRPVPSAHVTICDRASKTYWLGVNEHDHVFDKLDVGTLTLLVWSDDSALASVEVDVAGGESKQVEVKLAPRESIDGIVVDDAGAPIADASIETTETMGCGPNQKSETKSAADGTFHLRVTQHIDHDVFAAGAGYRTHGGTVPVDSNPARIVLQRTATVRFVLRPPAGIDVPLRIEWKGVDNEGFDVDSDDPSRTEGQFDLAVGAALSTRRITIRVEGFIPVELPVHPEFGKTTDLGDVVLDPGATVRVRAVDADGHPEEIRSMTVLRAEGDDTALGDGAHQDDGSFVARGIPPGPAAVYVEAPWFLPETVAIEAAAAAPVVVVTLKRGAVLRIRIVDADGFVHAADTVTVSDAGGHELDKKLDEETRGTWTGRYPAGKYHVAATTDDVTVESDVALVEGATKEITLRFAR